MTRPEVKFKRSQRKIPKKFSKCARVDRSRIGSCFFEECGPGTLMPPKALVFKTMVLMFGDKKLRK